MRRTRFGLDVPDLTNQQRTAIYRRDGERCNYCACSTADEWHIDHVVPVWVGGGNRPDNLVVACADCNQRKGAELDAFWCRLLVANGGPVGAEAGRRLLEGYFHKPPC